MKSLIRSLFVLAAALPAWASGSPDPGIAFERTGAVVNTRESAGSITVTVENLSPEGAGGALFRFIPLPAGAVEAEVLPPEGAAAKRGIAIEAGRPMIARGLQVLPVSISAPAGAAGKAGTQRMEPFEFRIRYAAGPGKAGSGAALAHSRGFFQSFAPLLPDNARGKTASDGEGSYLILTSPELYSTIEDFYLWKRYMGFAVSAVTTIDTGTRNDEIAAYIKNLYETSDTPPQYLLIVGDVEQVPSFDYHQSVSDLPYSLLDGDDFLPDIEVGRLPVRNASEAATVFAKIIEYERNPYRDAGDDWFSRALVVGGDYGSATPVPVSRWCREQLYNSDYSEVDSVFYPDDHLLGIVKIPPIINRGVSLVSYRGWAIGSDGWEAPRFTLDHIPSLTNGMMLPVVLSFVCLNGDYSEPECMGEAWLRTGTVEEPRGAVAFIGNSEHWSHTRHNDAAAIGAFTAFREEGVRRIGQILNASKNHILSEFHEQMDYEEWEDISAEFYYYIYSLLGDPSMEIRSAAPVDIEVGHPDSLAYGATVVEVDVVTADGKAPVAGTRVGLVQREHLVGSGWTDETGRARILYSLDEEYAALVITVTGAGVEPYQDSMEVATSGYLQLYAPEISGDDNGDGVLNPGETADLAITLRNLSAAGATNVSASLDALSGVTLDERSATFPDIEPFDTVSANQKLSLTVDDDAADGLLARFRVQAFAGAVESVNGFDLPIAAPAVDHRSHELVDASELAHGVETGIRVTVANDGSIAARGAQAVLRCDTPDIAEVVDSLVAFGADLEPDSSAVLEGFTILAKEDAGVGQAAVFTLETTTEEGYVLATSFSVAVGTADHTSPIGPDGYGYYCYDNSDTDYPDAAPLYGWITASAAYGGPGTKLDIEDSDMDIVDIPFAFRFYGKEYDRIAVCDNGWASFDTTYYFDFYNWGLPSVYGNGAVLAPFWDNLDPTKDQDGAPVGDGIYTWADTANHRFVIEWSRLGNLRSQHPDQVDYDDLQTFELVLYDPDFYPTPTGDGVVRYQYKQVVNNDTDRMYSSVGIENETGDVGLEYTYANDYPAGAAPLSAGLALTFTTAPPVYSPFTLARFDASRAGEGVRLAWEPADGRPRGSYRIYRAGADGEYTLVRGGLLPADRRGFFDGTASPDESWTYKIGSTDPVGRETVTGPYRYEAGGEKEAIRFALRPLSANPSRGAARLVRTLVDGPAEAGTWTAEWDGRDDRGEKAPSGVYLARIAAGGERRSVKITLLK